MRSVMMVEGTDDEHVVKHICGNRQLGFIDKIQEYGGKDELLEGIGPRLKESDLGAVGIVLDADTNVTATWRAVANRLQIAGVTGLPTDVAESGFVSSQLKGLPRVGVWLMPNNKQSGILEDFLGYMVAADDPLMTYVRTQLDRIPPELIRFPETRKQKALMHTWLALQANPGRPFGQAITARYLDPSASQIDPFTSWIRRVFFDN